MAYQAGGEKNLRISRVRYGDIEVSTFDALRHVCTGSERFLWELEEKPFFDHDTKSLWLMIYDNKGVFYPGSMGRGERTLFLRYPYYIANIGDEVIGGLGLKGKRTLRSASGEPLCLKSYYILVDPEHRHKGVGSRLVEHMESDNPSCDGFCSEWSRHREGDLSGFFRKQGYEIRDDVLAARAIKIR